LRPAEIHDRSQGGASSIPRLRIALAATLLILGIEVFGGVLARSLALLTDAAHMLTDVAATALALWAAVIARRVPDSKRTYGYGRATVLAATANASALLVIVVAIIYEAIQRFAHPQPVESEIMIAVGALSIALNLGLGWYLARGKPSLNMRAVLVHIAGDAVISGAVVIAAIAIFFTKQNAIDPAVSILAAILVVYSAWGVLKESLNVLLEGVPRGIDLSNMRAFLRRSVQIEDVHDLHVWSVVEGGIAASLHLRIDAAQLSAAPDIVRRVKTLLHDEFEVTHATVEVECVDCEAACAK
jgi:cobalt-zinc-cadmium efflux system protein